MKKRRPIHPTHQPDVGPDAQGSDLTRFQILVESASDWLWEVDAKGVYTYVSPRVRQLLGYEPDELIGKTPFDLMPPDEAQRVRGLFNALAVDHKPIVSLENTNLHKSGRSVVLETSGVPILDAEGNLLGYRGIDRDITERKRTEQALRISEEQLKHAARVAGLGIFDHDQITGKIQWAGQIREICGWPADLEVDLSGWVERVYPDDRGWIAKEIARAHDPTGDGRYSVEHRITRMSDGAVRWVSVRSQTFFEGEGAARRPVRTVGATLDITERKNAEDALNKSEEILRQAMEGSNDGIWAVDMKTNAVYLSPRDCEILGYAPDEMQTVAGAWNELVHPDDLPLTQERLAAYLAGRASIFEVEQRLRTKSGAWKWVLTRGKAAERDEQNNPIRLTGTHTDIADRKRVEETLRETTQRLSAIVQASPEAIIALDLEGRVTVWSPAAQRIFGWSEQEAIGQPLPYVPPEKHDEHDALRERVRRGEVSSFEVVRRKKDGSDILLSISVAPLRDSRGRIVGFMSVNLDITERKRSEEALRETTERLSAIVQASAEAIITLDMSGMVVTWSPAAERMFGWSEREAIGHRMPFVPPEKMDEHKVLVARILGGEALTFEAVRRRKDGSEIIIRSSAAPMRDDKGQVIGLLSITSDFTDRRRAQEQLEQEQVFTNTILASMPGMLVLYDTQGYPVRWNKQHEEITGYSADEMPKKHLLDWFAGREPDTSIVRQGMADLAAKGHAEVEASLITRDGRAVPCIFTAVSLTIAGKPYVLGIGHDITDRKRAEEAMQASEQRFHSLFVNMTEGVALHSLVFDPGGKPVNYRIVDVNDQYCRIVGVQRESVVGRLATEAYKTAQPPYMDVYCRVALSGQAEMLETYFAPMDKHFAISVASWGDHGFATIFLDITERKRAEAQARLNADRVQSLLTLNQMADASLQEITDFAMDAAVRLTSSTLGYVAFVNEQEDVLTMHSWSKAAMAECEVEGKPQVYPLAATGLWGEALRQRKPVITNDYAADNPLKRGCPPGHVKLTRHMNVPILSGGKVVLVAGVGNKDQDYNQTDVQQLRLLMGGLWRLVDRKRAIEAIARSEGRFKSILSAAPTGIGVVVERRFVEVNQRMCDMTGFSRDELLGQSARMVYPSQEEFERVGREKYAQIDTSGTGAVETKWLRKDGSVIDVLLSSSPIDPADQGVGVTFTALDITDRKRAQVALQEKIEELDRYFNSSMDLLCIADTGGHFRRLNPEWSRTLGYSTSEMEGKLFVDFVHPDDVESTNEATRALASQQTVLNFANRYRCKDGTYRWLEWRSHPVGEVIYAVARDVTDRKQAEEALRESRQMLQRVLDTIPARVFWKDRNGVYLGGNIQFIRDAGIETLEKLIGKSDFDIGWGGRGYAEKYFQDDMQIIQSGIPKLNYEEPATTPDGRTIWVLTSKIPLSDEAGNIRGVLGAYQDITDRKLAEEALRESETRYRGLVELSPDAIFINRNDRIELVNPAALELFGATSAEQILGRSPLEMFHPDCHELVRSRIQTVLTGQLAPLIEETVLRLDGTVRTVEVAASPFVDRHGMAIQVFLRDITDRKQAMEALQKSEAKFRLVFETSPVGMVMCEMDGRFVEANQAFLDIIGYSREEALKLGYWDVTPREYDEDEARQLRSIEETGKYGPYEKEYTRKNGQRVPVLLNGVVITTEGVRRIWSLVSDITERKRAEAELDEARRLYEATRPSWLPHRRKADTWR